MRTLKINPADHDIYLCLDVLEDGIANVAFKFSETSGSFALTETEARRIGTWFQNLAAEIANSEKE